MPFRLGRFVPHSRRAKVCCGGVVLLSISALLLIPAITGWIVRAQLASLVADQLNAELRIGAFQYHAPYGITVYDTSLVAAGPGGQPVDLLTVKRLDLTLARSPLSSGPLVIKELLIQDPSIHLIKTADGLIGEKSLVKTADGPEPPKQKLSEIFELRRISIARGQVVYENQTKAGSVPLVWRGLQLDLNTQPQAPAVYAYHLQADAASVATLDAQGDFNIDELLLRVAGCTLDAILKPDAPQSPLPGELQQSLRNYAIDGKLHFSTSGSVPLRALERAGFEGTAKLTNARACLPDIPEADMKKLDLNVAFKTRPGDVPAMNLEVKSLNAETEQVAISLKNAAIELASDRWKIEKLQGAATFAEHAKWDEFRPGGTLEFAASAEGQGQKSQRHDIQLQAKDFMLGVPDFPQPFEHIAGVVRAVDGKITVEPITATYGSDHLRIDRVTIPLDVSDQHVRIQDIAASVDFGSPAAEYPTRIADVLTALRPTGAFLVGGSVDIDESGAEPKTDYNISLSGDRGILSPPALPMLTLFPKFKAAITPGSVNVTGIKLPLFDGTVTGSLRMKLGEQTSYEGNFDLSQLQLAEAKVLWIDENEPDQDLRGKMSGKVRVAGEIPPDDQSALDEFRADGTVRVVDGYFYEVPVLREISDWLQVQGGSVIGEGAATFAVQDRIVQLKRCVVSAPVLAAQGKGDIGFDGKLNLVVTAATPSNIRQDGGNRFIRGIFGVVNQGLASAGQWGLLEFHVTGNQEKPKLTTATPAIGQTIDTVVGGIRDFARNATKH